MSTVTVRGTRTSDGTELISVHDFIGVVYQETETESRRVWCDLISRDASHHTLSFMYYTIVLRDNEGESGAETPVMTAKGMQRLLVVLEGEVTVRFRQNRVIVIEHV